MTHAHPTFESLVPPCSALPHHVGNHALGLGMQLFVCPDLSCPPPSPAPGVLTSVMGMLAFLVQLQPENHSEGAFTLDSPN